MGVLDIDGEVRRRCAEAGDEVGVLVRYNGSRQRKVIDADGKAVDLRKHVEDLKKVATCTIEIDAQGGKRCARWCG